MTTPRFGTIVAPWDEATVAGLNAWQSAEVFHPFTCPRGHDGPRPALLATREGWVCPDDECEYTQAWAHDFMVLASNEAS